MPRFFIKNLAKFFGLAKTTQTWFDAVDKCKEKNLTLAFPRTDEDLDAITREFFRSINTEEINDNPYHSYGRAWIGLRTEELDRSVGIRLWKDLYGINHNYLKYYRNRSAGDQGIWTRKKFTHSKILK